MKSEGPLYYTPHARYAEQAAEMERLEAAGHCVFCSPDAEAVMAENASWRVIANKWPYRGSRDHLLILPRRHVTDFAELLPFEWVEFSAILKYVRWLCGLGEHDASLGLVVRSGNPVETGATIRHLHWHLVHGDHDDPGRQEIRVKISTGRPRVAD